MISVSLAPGKIATSLLYLQALVLGSSKTGAEVGGSEPEIPSSASSWLLEPHCLAVRVLQYGLEAEPISSFLPPPA